MQGLALAAPHHHHPLAWPAGLAAPPAVSPQRLLAHAEGAPDSDLRDYAGKGRDSLDEALQALVDGEVSVRAQLAGFESLAQELLAVDFDDRHAPEIERLRSALRSDAGVGAV